VKVLTTDGLSHFAQKVKSLFDSITVPTKVSELENDSGYLTEQDIEEKVADYIIECGTAGGWNYEKWNSGKYVCTRVYKETLTHYTTVGGFYGYVTSQIQYPIAFPELPVFYYNAKVANGFAIPAGDVVVGLSSCRCYALSTASGEAACTFEIHVEGRWK